LNGAKRLNEWKGWNLVLHSWSEVVEPFDKLAAGWLERVETNHEWLASFLFTPEFQHWLIRETF
jgi:hypothetical protein